MTMAASAGSEGEERKGSTDAWKDNALAQVSNYVDRNLREFQYGGYVVVVIGLAMTVRSLRLFGQFKTVAKIPKDYFRKNASLRGTVRDVDSTSGVLQVEHTPIIRLFGGKNQFPVRLSGVHVGPMGAQWLKTTTKDDRIQFVLLAANRNKEAESIVTVSEGFLKERCLNLEVVRLGMGQVAPRLNDLAKNKLYRKLYLDLLAVEAEAVGDHRGLWFSSAAATTRPRRSAKKLAALTLSAIWNGIVTTLKYVMPAKRSISAQH